MTEQSVTEQNGSKVLPKEVENFFDKYQRGLRIVTEGAQAETGLTPKETIWTKNKAKLYHYQPGVEKQHATPILIVYALINRPYVLDLIRATASSSSSRTRATTCT